MNIYRPSAFRFRLKKSMILTIFSAFLLNSAAHAKREQAGFDEIFDINGKPRPEYQEIWHVYESLTATQKKQFISNSRKAFQGDNILDPLPRVISAEEYDSVLKPGVEQRAKAIRMFLEDHYSGKRLYKDAKIFPKKILNKIINRTQEASFKKHLTEAEISFIYGPDIIKDRSGNWRVIEDNVGFVGGLGDLTLANKFLTNQIPDYTKNIRTRNPESFYLELTKRLKERASKKGGIAILYMMPPYPDNEDKRIKEIFRNHGIEAVTPYSKLQLKYINGEFFVYDSSKSKPKYQKVGYLFLNGEHWWLDPSHATTFEKFLIEEAKLHLEQKGLDLDIREQLNEELEKNKKDIAKISKLLKASDYSIELGQTMMQSAQSRNLLESYYDGKIGLNYTPGIDFIGDKEFYLYVEDLIRFYLYEEPILKNIETKKFVNKKGVFKKERLKEVFSNFKSYVVKKVDGRGGDAVWVGAKISPNEIPAIIEKIKLSPQDYIYQEYTPLSQLEDRIVDLRILSEVGPDSILVTDTPWGRGLPASGNGKVNLSAQGREVTVLISQGSWNRCQNALAK